jgi:hypothetical protein
MRAKTRVTNGYIGLPDSGGTVNNRIFLDTNMTLEETVGDNRIINKEYLDYVFLYSNSPAVAYINKLKNTVLPVIKGDLVFSEGYLKINTSNNVAGTYILADIDKRGLVTGGRTQLKSDDFSDNSISFNAVFDLTEDKTYTLEDYGITDLMPNT